MATLLRARIVRVGNSRGIRIPKVVLDQLDIGPEVEMAVQSDRLVIRAARRTREGWSRRFAAMAAQQDDRLVLEVPGRWDKSEWQW
ncbi:MAG: AbrB/MazE/SpoVT family DNA-binding domain-containing protein [Candidatus Brocadiia bacterium]